MHTTHLRKVGGSVMLRVPPGILNLLHLKAGDAVGLDIEDGLLVIDPNVRQRFTLEELLTQCDEHAPVTDEDHEWDAMSPVGKELI
jgi:antitoxin ChpS